MPIDFEKIKQLREAAGLTQGAAAEAAGFKGPHAKIRWYEFEAGKYRDLRVSTLEAVAAALGVPITELLTGPPAKPSPGAQPSRRKRPSGSAGSKG